MAEEPGWLADLQVLVGEWVVELPGAPAGRVVVEEVLGGAFLLQRSESPQPEFPDGLVVVAPAPGGFVQHHFDSRGVTRLYRMTFADRTWTLLRTEPDSSPLDFAQRFTGTVAPDGDRIDGRWETSRDGGATWELDFPLTYTRA